MTRGNTIKYAVVGALFSKASSALLQIFSLPLAARVLGKEEFGVYSLVSLSIFILSMLQLGVGPALSRMIAETSAKGRRESERHAFLSGLVLTVGIVIAGVCALSLVIFHCPMIVLFGEEFEAFEEILKNALLLGMLFTGAEIIMRHTDRTLEGYLEAHVNHTILSFSNLAGAVLIYSGIQHFPSITFLLVATFIPKLLSRIVSTILMIRRHPHLLEGWTTFRKDTFRTLILDGISFSSTTNLVYLIEVFACGLLIGRLLGPGEVAVYQIFATISAIFSGLILMVVRPYWTASVNAREQDDHAWVSRATSKLLIYCGLMVGGVGTFMILLGPWMIEMLYGEEFRLSRTIFVAHFCFLALAVWRDVSLYMMIGLGKLKEAVVPIVVGLLISLTAGYFGLVEFGLTGMFVGLATGIAVFPAWRLGIHVFRTVDLELPKSAISWGRRRIAANN